MPEIQVRPAISSDIPLLAELDHDYVTDYVWQMEIQQPEAGQVSVQFRQSRLPRSVRVEYPRSPRALLEDWPSQHTLLVAILDGEVVGYINLSHEIAPRTTWVTDLAVVRRLRRQGLATALIVAADQWATERGSLRLVLEMQPKNYPVICLAQKLGFDFCGYNDRYYVNHDIALFFAKSIR
jgi:GNAT superfamily N-acetyltransferase